MTVLYAHEIWSGRTAKDTKDFTREYVRMFDVQTSDPSDSGGAVRAYVGIPQRGAVYSAGGFTDVDARCTDVSASNSSEDPCQWRVTCNYSTNLTTYQDDPTRKPTQYSHSTEWVEKAMTEDLDGYIISNSAYESFDPPATRRTPVDIIKASCVRSSYLASQDKDPYIDRVNSLTYVIDSISCEPGTLLCDDISVSMLEQNGLYYRKFDYTFKRRRDYETFGTSITDYKILGAPGSVPVHVASLQGITANMSLIVNKGKADQETITVTSVNTIDTSITATFANAHTDNPVVFFVEFSTHVAGAGVATILVESTKWITVGMTVVVNVTEADEESIVVISVDPVGGTISAVFAQAHTAGGTLKVTRYPVTLEGQRTGQPWQFNPLDCGFNTWNPDTFQNEEIWTRSGQPIAHPALLDGEGTRLPIWTDPPATPVFLLYRIRETADFNLLTFP